MRLAALLAATWFGACGGAPKPLPSQDHAMPAVTAYDPKATYEIVSEELTFTAAGETVPATVVHPRSGAWPGIVMFAGSGASDRDWNNPLAKGKNGSGKLIAGVIVGQIANQFDAALKAKQIPEAYATTSLAKINAAFDDFLAGKAVDAKTVSDVPALQQLLGAIFYPATVNVTRALFGIDPAAEAAKVTVPVLVMNGQKDVQVDPERDAKRLAAALGAHATFELIPDANHQFKREERPLAKLLANRQLAVDAYNAETSVLDRTAMEIAERWLADNTR